MSATNHPNVPSVLPWDQRYKGVLPLPGGNSGYLDSLRQLCTFVNDHRSGPQPYPVHRRDAERVARSAGHWELLEQV